MKKWIVRSLLAVVLIYGGAVVAYNIQPKPQTQASVVTKQNPPTPDELLKLINEERAKVGVKPLVIDQNVQKSAQLKATDFVERNYYAHEVPGTTNPYTVEMATLLNASCTYVSENINADSLSSQSAVTTWMASPPHKKAILDPKFTSTGFGVSQDTDGDYYTVEHFCIAK